MFFEVLKVLVTQSCPTLFDPMHCSPPGSSVHGILQARILEWVDISFSSNQILIFSVSCIGRWILYCYHHLGSLLLPLPLKRILLFCELLESKCVRYRFTSIHNAR